MHTQSTSADARLITCADGTALWVKPYDFHNPPAPRPAADPEEMRQLMADITRGVVAEVMGGDPTPTRCDELARIALVAGASRSDSEELADHIRRLHADRDGQRALVVA
jgi:hypothetical protein